MLRDAKVQDYMTSSVISVPPVTPIRIAQQLMEDQHIRHLLVVDKNKLVGVLSSGDIRRAGPSTTTTLSIWEIARYWERVTVEQVMTREVVRVRPETSVTQAAHLMMCYHINSLPVVDKDDYPIGILTEVDIFRLLDDASMTEASSTQMLNEAQATKH